MSDDRQARESTHTRIARAPRSRAAKAIDGAVVLRAGDTVLLCFNSPVEHDDFGVMVDMLRAHAPGVMWAMVDNVTGVLVQKGGPVEYEGPEFYCSRVHTCAVEGEGPCNGYPRTGRDQRGERTE